MNELFSVNTKYVQASHLFGNNTDPLQSYVVSLNGENTHIKTYFDESNTYLQTEKAHCYAGNKCIKMPCCRGAL